MRRGSVAARSRRPQTAIPNRSAKPRRPAGVTDYGAAAGDPLDPAQREAARRERGAERAADMRHALAPIEAGAAEHALAGTRSGGRIDPEIGEKGDAGDR